MPQAVRDAPALSAGGLACARRLARLRPYAPAPTGMRCPPGVGHSALARRLRKSVGPGIVMPRNAFSGKRCRLSPLTMKSAFATSAHSSTMSSSGTVAASRAHSTGNTRPANLLHRAVHDGFIHFGHDGQVSPGPQQRADAGRSQQSALVEHHQAMGETDLDFIPGLNLGLFADGFGNDDLAFDRNFCIHAAGLALPKPESWVGAIGPVDGIAGTGCHPNERCRQAGRRTERTLQQKLSRAHDHPGWRIAHRIEPRNCLPAISSRA